jgi:hypothetical protein
MAILHLFYIETAYESCLTHIINQTIFNLDDSVVVITDYSFFTIEQNLLDFENLNSPCLKAGDLTLVVRPHSFNGGYLSN